jgi:acyl dehydratase
MHYTELKAKPSLAKQYFSALTTKADRNVTSIPQIGFALREQVIDRDNVTQYVRLCGFKENGVLPITYPQVLATPLHIEVMTQANFPFKLLGLVHVNNVINQYRPINIDESVDIYCRAGDLYATDKGMEAVLISELRVAGELVWDSTSTMLSRGYVPSGVTPSPVKNDLTVNDYVTEQWEVASDTGRRYAAISGDRNPIHLYPLTAKMFGFPRHIVHGMWTKAKALAEIDKNHNIFANQTSVEVQFKTPIFLPATVCFSHREKDNEINFKVTDKNDKKPHVVGHVTTS